MVTARIGAGQRALAGPVRRQPRVCSFRFGSISLKNDATVRTAGPRVKAARTATSMPTAQGTPSDSKYGNRQKLRQYIAPAMVSPDPSTTWAVLWNIV